MSTYSKRFIFNYIYISFSKHRRALLSQTYDQRGRSPWLVYCYKFSSTCREWSRDRADIESTIVVLISQQWEVKRLSCCTNQVHHWQKMLTLKAWPLVIISHLLWKHLPYMKLTLIPHVAEQQVFLRLQSCAATAKCSSSSLLSLNAYSGK